jgi:hypothetical protein
MSADPRSLWIVIGHSESGDNYAAAFRKKPTVKALKELANSWDGEEGHDGPGYGGSYVYLRVEEQPLR